jgi:hypothetical protein
MASFEMLYGRSCRTPLFWSEAGEWKVFGLDILQEAENKFIWLGRGFALCNQDKRAMPTIGEEN